MKDLNPVKIIVNPKAGGGRALGVLHKAERILWQNGWKFDITLTNGPGHATEIAGNAATRQVPLIAVIGGDGTINEVVQSIQGTDTRLAIIPGGTGNDLARSLGIPLHHAKAVATMARGKVISMDIGHEQGRDFSCLVALGFPVDVIRHTNQKQRLLGGSLAILSSVWQTIRELQVHHFQVQLDDNKPFALEACGIFVLNTPCAGGGFRFSPQANITDGLLDILIIGPVTTWDLLTALPKAYKGKHLAHPAVSLHRAGKVSIRTVDPLLKMYDGEIIGRAPITATVKPKALRVIAPVEYPIPGPLVSQVLAWEKVIPPISTPVNL